MPATELLNRDPMFAEREGQPVTRRAVCECGTGFRQRMLSARFLAIVEGHSQKASDLLAEQVPEGFVPVHCPRCERKELRLIASRYNNGY